jgi:hypothetical protein
LRLCGASCLSAEDRLPALGLQPRAAIRHSANGPDNPIWIKVELERFEAKEIAAKAKARARGPALATAGPGPSFEVPALR